MPTAKRRAKVERQYKKNVAKAYAKRKKQPQYKRAKGKK